MKSTYVVTVTPAQENAGAYDVSYEVVSIPEDIDFLTMYQCSDLDQAMGYFDMVVEKLGVQEWDEPEWLDNLNRCLTVGHLAQVSLYRFAVAKKKREMARLANTVIMVGGEVRK